MNPQQLGIVTPNGFPAFPAHWSMDLGHFGSADGRSEIATYHLKNSKRESGSILVVFHGFGEYSGRYMHLPHYLDGLVGEMFLMDHLGHGRSKGKRGHSDDFDVFTADIENFLSGILEKSAAKKVFVLAHSFGGLVLMKALQEKRPSFEKVTGLLASSPYLGLKIKVPAVKEFAAKILSRTWKGLSLSSEFDPSVLSRDPAVMEAYHADKLNHSRITPGMFSQIETAQGELLKGETEVAVPISFWVSTNDPLVDADRAIELFEAHLVAPKKELFAFPGQRHEMMNEITKEKFFEGIEKWMRSL